jgi:hypothetical protein
MGGGTLEQVDLGDAATGAWRAAWRFPATAAPKVGAESRTWSFFIFIGGHCNVSIFENTIFVGGLCNPSAEAVL